MPIIKGTMGYTRFLVNSEAVLDAASLVDKINLFRFKPLHPLGEDKESLGFCPYLSEYDLDKTIEIKDFFYDENILLSMRIDTIALPKELLKANVKKSITGYYKDHKKWPDKTVKKEIELAESKALRARVLPKTKIIEAMWNQKQSSLRIFSRSKVQVDQFCELFTQTFLIRPERCDFSHQALSLKAQLEVMAHQPLFNPTLRVDVQ